MATDIEQLERQRAELNERISEIREAEAEKVSAQLVGRCFKYRNNYSCPETDADYWWLYFKVTGFEGARLTGVSFQRDVYGEMRVDPNAGAYNHMSEYVEVDSTEYVRARADFLTTLNVAVSA